MRVDTEALSRLKQLILEKTEGTPFFMEEIVQELMEQGVLVRDGVGARLRPGFSSIGQVPLPTDLHIPTTVQGVLASRIDRLTPEEKNEERWSEAELSRLKGELTLQLEARDWRLETSPASAPASSLKPQASAVVAREAEGYFLKALAIARRQQAKFLELRATVSLARLWQQQGKTVEAHRMLSDIYNWFTAGFDTVDLKEAKAWLEELA